MMNYYFIDGSSLTAQIRQLRRQRSEYKNRKLCPTHFISHFNWSLADLHNRSYKRATFYFPTGDELSVGNYLRMPDSTKPGIIKDIYFKYCGYKLKRSAEFERFVDINVPEKFKDRFAKSEKGIDTEICCDVLKLASSSKIDRVLFLTNDSDFVPLFRAVKEFGSNISLIHLSLATAPNNDLLRESDSYDVVTDSQLSGMFFESENIDQENYNASIKEKTDQEKTFSDLSEEPEKPISPPSDFRQLEKGVELSNE